MSRNKTISYYNTDIELDGNSKFLVNNISTNTINAVEIMQNGEAIETNNILTTKGDLMFHDNLNSNRLPVGTDGQVLIADSTIDNGIKWETISTTIPDDLEIKSLSLEKDIPGFDGILKLNNTEGDDMLDYTAIEFKAGTTHDYNFIFSHLNRLYFGSTSIPEFGYFDNTTGDYTTTHDITCNTLNYNSLNPPVAAGFVSPLTNKGDLIVHNGITEVRQNIGSNGKVLMADSTEANGIKWGTALTDVTSVAGDMLYRSGGALARLPGATRDNQYLMYTTPGLPNWTSNLYAGYLDSVSGINPQMRIYNANAVPVDNYRSLGFYTSDGTDTFIQHANNNNFFISSSTQPEIYKVTNTGRTEIHSNSILDLNTLDLINENTTPSTNYVRLGFHPYGAVDSFWWKCHNDEFSLHSTTTGAGNIIKFTNTGGISAPSVPTVFSGYYVCVSNDAARTWTYSGSSLRYKTLSETSLFDDTTRLYDLIPKEYYFNDDTTQRPNYSIIAEDCDIAFPELCIYQEYEPGLFRPDSVDDQSLLCVCVAEMKKLRTELTAAQSTITNLNNSITLLNNTQAGLLTTVASLQTQIDDIKTFVGM